MSSSDGYVKSGQSSLAGTSTSSSLRTAFISTFHGRAAPRIGPDQAYDALSRYRSGWRVELHIVHLVAEGDVVLAERLECFQKPGDTTVHDLYVMGAFEMKDGKIAKWRDYFDSRHVDPFID